MLDMFAGIHVRNFGEAKAWYAQLFGSEPSFLPHDTEAAVGLGQHRWVFIEENADRAGYAEQVIFVDDLDALVAEIAQRGTEPAKEETYGNGVGKVLFRDADGNEFGFGGRV